MDCKNFVRENKSWTLANFKKLIKAVRADPATRDNGLSKRERLHSAFDRVNPGFRTQAEWSFLPNLPIRANASVTT
jgi:hypothetical protein